MSSPRQPYRPDPDYTPFDRYQDAAETGLEKARAELEASKERVPTFEQETGDVA